jgi:hypothetical protein
MLAAVVVHLILDQQDKVVLVVVEQDGVQVHQDFLQVMVLVSQEQQTLAAVVVALMVIQILVVLAVQAL